MQSTYHHPQIGTILVKTNSRARRFIFRSTDDGLLATVPLRATEVDLMHSIEALLPKLLKMIERKNQKVSERQIDSQFRIDTDDFKLHFRQGLVPSIQARFNNGILEFVYPETIDFKNKEIQTWIIKIAEEALRHQSKRILLPRLKSLATSHGFKFTKGSIHKTHGRWGSCSSKGNINLSLYLILLPKHLQNYVILHELCHTRHMDHSARFWALLDSISNEQSETLRKEMKQYDTSIFFHR